MCVTSFFRSFLGDENQWHFVKLEVKPTSDPDEVDEEREVVLRHVTTSVARSIEIGKIGAYAFDLGVGEDRGEEDCYLVEFISLPHTKQEDDKDVSGCAWKVDCHWLNCVPRARHWFAKSHNTVTLNLVCVVATDVEMKPMSPSNMVRNPSVRRDAARLGALRITDESHELIMDEIERRERLECDPSRVFIDEVEDSDSEEENEELVENF